MSSILRFLGCLLVPAFVLVGCAKEEPVKPCSEHDGMMLRSVKTPDGPGEAYVAGPSQGINVGTDNPDGPKDPSISDDGDDMADRERSSKKRRRSN